MGCGLLRDLKPKREGCAFANLRTYLKTAARVLHHSLADGKPKACAVCLRGEKWEENALELIGRNTRTRIDDLNLKIRIF